jgi:hypothetical protein
LRKLFALSAILAFGATSTAHAKLTPERINYWERIHQCEQPDAWSHLQFSEYSGGLGISNGAWDWWAGELGLTKRYPTAGHAPRLVQIRVADYGWRIHRGSWPSMNKCGYPPS